MRKGQGLLFILFDNVSPGLNTGPGEIIGAQQIFVEPKNALYSH